MDDTRMERFQKYLNKSNLDHKSYQYDGVQWCLNNELRINPPCNVRGGFIADEMGLGKTIMMIGLMYCNFLKHTLIVVPPILLDQWNIQIYKTTGHKALVYYGENKKYITIEHINSAPIVLTTYGAITLTNRQHYNKEITLLHKIAWSRIIFDEAHHLRNNKTSCYRSVQLLKVNICWLVSGTPIQNSKKDFYSLCNLIRLPFSFYAEERNLKELARSFILKRTKKQVGIQITDINYDKKIINWTSEKEMKLSEDLHSALKFSNVILEKSSNNPIVNMFKSQGPLVLMLRAKQSCIYPKLMVNKLLEMNKKNYMYDYSLYKEMFNSSSKLNMVIDVILQRKNNNCGKLIFCHFREEMDEIANRLRIGGIKNVATFDGRTSNSQRYNILNGKNDVLILQIQTGCEGLNLQENYNEIYFISPHWNPCIEDQAIARCHRIGQTKPVYVVRFEMSSFQTDKPEISTKTIEKYVYDLQDEKRSIANEIIDNSI